MPRSETTRPADDAREVRRAELSRELGGQQIWFHDDPGVREVLLDIDCLRVLDFARRIEEPVQPDQLLGLDASLAPKATSILRKLEIAGFVRYVSSRGGAASGYASAGPIFTVVHAGSEAALRLVGDHREMVARHNARHVGRLSEQPFRDHAQEPFIDRVFLMSEREEASLRDAVFRLFQTTAAIETANSGRGLTPNGRRRVRLTVTLERAPEVEPFPYVAPVLVVNMGKQGLSASWVRSLAALLTPRQKEIAALLVEGLSRKTIGDRLGITENTVKSAIREMYRKVDVKSRAEFVRKLQG